MKKCKPGYYYCNTDKKCKKIPRGYRTGYGGYLRKETDDDSKNKSNGNGNGNGNGGNGNGNGGNGSNGNGGGGNGGGMGESLTFDEAKMTEKQKRKDKYLKKKYDKSDDMKDNFKKQYGEEEGKKVYFAYIRKKAMQEDSEKKTGRVSSGATEKKRKNALLIQKVIGSSNELEGEYIPEEKDKKLSKIVKQLRKSVKSHGNQADYIEKINEKNCGCGQTPCKTYGKDVKEAKNIDDKLKKTAKELDAAVKMHTKQAERLRAMVNVKEESNPRIPRKKGQPANSKKHSDLYTDENPKGTIHGLGFKDVATAKASVAKIRKSSRSHAHKIQAAVAMEQRAREMGKSSEAAVFRKYINSMKKKTKKMNESSVALTFDSNRKRKFDVNVGGRNVRQTLDTGREIVNTAKDLRDNIKSTGGLVSGVQKTIKGINNRKTTETSTDIGGMIDAQIKKYNQNIKSSYEMGEAVNAAQQAKIAIEKKKKGEKPKKMNEGSLHKWFKGSKSKDGKGGWVNVVTGGTCASDEPGEGTPKCVSSAKRASMTKAERLSAARRKKKADPGQQSKSGAAKPTYVSTDSPRKKKKMKEEIELTETKDKKGKGSGSKDACYHKVKSRYSVWPSAYASGALVKCRKVGAANWGNSKKEEFEPTGLSFQQFMEKCWKGYEKKGMKTMFGKRYPNCVKKEEAVFEHHQKDKDGNTVPHDDGTPSSVEEGAAWTKKSGKNPSGGLNEKGRKSYERENPGSDLKRPSKKVGNKRRASFCARMRGMKKKLTSAKTARDPDSRINKSLRAWNC